MMKGQEEKNITGDERPEGWLKRRLAKDDWEIDEED